MYYTAITIGPIYETLQLAASPAALWFASGLFSYLSEGICKKILESFSDDTGLHADIINPYYPQKDHPSGSPYEIRQSGIGKYHDRIFFTSSAPRETISRKLDQILSDTKKEIGTNISSACGYSPADTGACVRFFENYFNIHYVIADESLILETSNCILAFSDYLDALEISEPIPQPVSAFHPLMKLFTGTQNARNAYLHSTFLVPETNFQLTKKQNSAKPEDTFRDIEDIANPSGKPIEWKKQRYYAFVKSDGDFMGETLKHLTTKEQLVKFSEACLHFTSSAADRIGAYGGLTIFAGGDDLLFLAPVENDAGENIFDLCSSIREDFKNAFDRAGITESPEIVHKPTLSFGIAVNYYKYPLYEALNEADSLLYEAKYSHGDDKNKTLFALHKHSGQSERILLPNESVSEKVLAELIRKRKGDSNFLNSILFHLRQYSSSGTSVNSASANLRIIEAAAAVTKNLPQTLDNLFDNLFDSGAHTANRDYINTIRDQLKMLYNAKECSDPVGTLLQMLWIVKFLQEKGSKHDGEDNHE